MASMTARALAPEFPSDVARGLIALAETDGAAYRLAIASVLESFETRRRYLEGIPVADTVITLQSSLAREQSEVPLRSPLLPA